MTFEQLIQLIEVLKWPICGLIALGLVFVAFRVNIASFLDRVKRIGKDGLHAEPISKPELQTKENEQKNIKMQIQELLQPLHSPVILEKENAIRAELKQRDLPFEGASIDILITYLAQTQLALVFEQTYRLIFGSQIYLLKYANERGGLSQNEIDGHFENVKKLFEPNFDEWSVEKYLYFLLAHSLLTKSEGEYFITNLGVDFLGWVVRRGYTENKNL
jgi:hypothetical protein